MTLYKFIVACNVSVENFGGFANLTIFCNVSVHFAPSAISPFLANCIICHFHGIPEFNTIREKISILGFCKITLSCCGCFIVKAHIMGNYGFYIVLIAQVSYIFFSGEISYHFAKSGAQIIFITSNFIGIICACHYIRHSDKCFIDDERESFFNIALAVMYTTTYIVYNRIIHIIASFSINCEIV